MKEYATKQRQALLSFFAEHKEEAIPVQKIIDALQKAGVSKSAVYRNLAEQEACGKIRRVNVPGERATYYRYVATKHCEGKLHLSCVKCGKTCHVSARLAGNLSDGVASENGFSLLKDDTVLYGVCETCMRDAAQGEKKTPVTHTKS